MSHCNIGRLCRPDITFPATRVLMFAAWSSKVSLSSFGTVHSLCERAFFLCLQWLKPSGSILSFLFRHNFSIFYEYFSWIWVSDEGKSPFLFLSYWFFGLSFWNCLKVYFSIRLLIKPSCVQNRFGVFYWPIPWRVSFTFEVGFFCKTPGAAPGSQAKQKRS